MFKKITLYIPPFHPKMSVSDTAGSLTGASRSAAGAVTNTQNDFSVGESVNPLEPFFGPLRGTHMGLRADDALSHETYNLPESYKGRSKHLEDILDFMIREEDEFYTRYLLPWEFTDELHVQWSIFRFNRTLADVEPHQGAPRLVTAETEARTENLIRRGLAFIIEHGFYKTERGRRHFMLNLQQIADAVHVTCNFGVMHCLLSGNNYYKEWHKRFADANPRRVEIFEQERRRWAIVQKQSRGLEILDAEIKHNMRLNGVTPNIWVFPSKMSIYMDLARDSSVHYDKAGADGPARLKDSTNKITSWRGCQVVEAAPFDIDFSSEHVSLLERSRMVGEFFVIPKGVESIQIFNANKDRFVTVTRAEALVNAANANLGDDPSTSPDVDSLCSEFDKVKKKTEDRLKKAIKKIEKMPAKKGDATSRELLEKAKKTLEKVTSTSSEDSYSGIFEEGSIASYESAASELEGADLMTLDGLVSVDKNMVFLENIINKFRCAAEGKATYLNRPILLMRPFATYNMASAVLAQGGPSLGATYHGHHDMLLSDDVIRKVHLGHYTFYSKSVLKRPKQCCIVEDIFSQGYIGGEGTDFFSPDQSDDTSFTEQFNQGYIGTRDVQADMFAWVVEEEPDHDVIDLTGHFDLSVLGRRNSKGPCFSGADQFVQDNNLHLLNPFKSIEDGYLKRVQPINTVMFRGTQKDQLGGVKGKGHWGEQVYDGCMKVRNGQVMTFKEECESTLAIPAGSAGSYASSEASSEYSSGLPSSWGTLGRTGL
ncbi:MAG: hypothetical protein CMO44_16360 [Verrucomicrobiales bacterium]|nr:hypothetical protein [Verrucomicrobiales bacterium]